MAKVRNLGKSLQGAMKSLNGILEKIQSTQCQSDSVVELFITLIKKYQNILEKTQEEILKCVGKEEMPYSQEEYDEIQIKADEALLQLIVKIGETSTKKTDEEEEVILPKNEGPLGFSIIGGTDHSCVPFGTREPGIFIAHIVPGGIAAKCGKIRMGDRILKVNDADVTRGTHQDAVSEFVKPCDEIKLTIQHDLLPSGFQEIIIRKVEGERLGMHIKGGFNGQRGNPTDITDEGVFVSKINSVGAARRDGRLKVAMRLLEVNGNSLFGASHQDAVNILRNAGSEIQLVVCKGYDKSSLGHLTRTTSSTSVKSNHIRSRIRSRVSEAGSKVSHSQSTSSLDREEDEHLKQELDEFTPNHEVIKESINEQLPNINTKCIESVSDDTSTAAVSFLEFDTAEYSILEKENILLRKRAERADRLEIEVDVFRERAERADRLEIEVDVLRESAEHANRLERQLETVQIEKQQLQQEQQQKIEQQNQKINELQGQIKQLEQNRSIVENQMTAELELNAKKAITELQQLQSEFETQLKIAEQHKHNLDETIHSLQSQIKLLQDELLKSQLAFKAKEDDLKRLLSQASLEKQQLQGELQQIQKDLKELTEQLNKAKEELQQSQQETERQQKQAAANKDKISKLKQLMENLQQSNAKISSTNAELSDALRTSEQKKYEPSHIFKLFEMEADQNTEHLLTKMSNMKQQLIETQAQLINKETALTVSQKSLESISLKLQNCQQALQEKVQELSAEANTVQNDDRDENSSVPVSDYFELKHKFKEKNNAVQQSKIHVHKVALSFIVTLLHNKLKSMPESYPY